MVTLSTLFPGKSTDKNARRKRIIYLLIFLITSATFAQFITEEAIQNYHFGIMSLTMNDDWDLLAEELPKYQEFHHMCHRFMYVTYCLNPVTGYYFQFYMEADQRKIDIWRKQCARHGPSARIILEGEVAKIATNGDGVAFIALKNNNPVIIKYPEIFNPMPTEGAHVQLTCIESYYRGWGLEVVKIEFR